MDCSRAFSFLCHDLFLLSKIFKSNTMKQVWAKRSAVNIIDSHKEYLNDISRIASLDYKPTTQDVLIARVRTTQVVIEKYRIDGSDFEMYDVGGQRSPNGESGSIVLTLSRLLSSLSHYLSMIKPWPRLNVPTVWLRHSNSSDPCVITVHSPTRPLCFS